MAGHSKWAQIKRQKGVTDVARSKVFSKFARILTLESKKCGGDQTAPSLAAIIARAKSANMPKDNIERAITKGAGKDSGNLERVTYEAFGPGGSALIVVGLTDNRNRTTQGVRHALTKRGFELGGPGSATWAFARQPDGTYLPQDPKVELSPTDEEVLSELLDALDDLEDVEEVFTTADGYESTRSE